MAYFAATRDDPDKVKAFAESLSADYPILADPTGDTARAFGVMSGDGGYPSRWTFYIGADGKILAVDKSVSPRTAGDDLAAKLAELGIPERP